MKCDTCDHVLQCTRVGLFGKLFGCPNFEVGDGRTLIGYAVTRKGEPRILVAFETREEAERHAKEYGDALEVREVYESVTHAKKEHSPKSAKPPKTLEPNEVKPKS